ncbi:TetR/AcrR family transcriptional regulator [Pseudomonas sp. HK3]
MTNVYSEHILDLDVYTVNNKVNNAPMTTNKTQYHHGDLASAFMDAAIKRIGQEGVDKLSLRAVARDLGVSQTAPYRHFNDKNHLLSLLAKQGFERLAHNTSEAASQHGQNTFDAIMALGMAYIDFGRQHPEHYRLMFGGMVDHHCDEEHELKSKMPAFNVILEQAESGVERGDLINQEPIILARSCWATVHGITMLLIDGFYSDHTPEALHEFLLNLLWFNLRGISTELLSVTPPV